MRNPTTIVARPIPAGGGLSLRGILHVVFRRKWLILLVFAVCAAAATTGVLYLTTPRYEAVAQILVSPGDVQLPTDGRSGGGSINPDERMARAIQLLTGRSLAEQVVEAVGAGVLYPDLSERLPDREVLRMAAVARLMHNLSVDAGGRSSIISLGFRHEDAKMAARVANLFSEQYVDRYLGVEKNPKVDAFFEDQLAARRQRLTESEQALDAFRRQHGISVSLPEERALAATELATLRSALAEARTRQAESQGQVDAMNKQLARDARIPRSFYQMKERLALLQTEENELALRFTPDHPKLRDVREQIKGLQDKLKSDAIDSPYSTATEQEQSSVGLQAELARARGELESARARQSALAARIDAARKRVESLENLDSEFNQLQTQLKADVEAHRLYLSKVQDLRMVNTRDAEKLVGIRLIEAAQAPSLPIDTKLNLKIMLGLLGSAFAAIGLAFLLQFGRARLETGEDVQRVLGLPVLGSIPELRSQ